MVALPVYFVMVAVRPSVLTVYVQLTMRAISSAARPTWPSCASPSATPTKAASPPRADRRSIASLLPIGGKTGHPVPPPALGTPAHERTRAARPGDVAPSHAARLYPLDERLASEWTDLRKGRARACGLAAHHSMASAPHGPSSSIVARSSLEEPEVGEVHRVLLVLGLDALHLDLQLPLGLQDVPRLLQALEGRVRIATVIEL